MPISACSEGPADHKMYAKCTKINRACGDYLLYHSKKYLKSVVLHEPCVLVRGCSNFINEPILTGWGVWWPHKLFGVYNIKYGLCLLLVFSHSKKKR